MKSVIIVVILIVQVTFLNAQPATFTNPIIAGFHPDPSVCRVGEDYYLINSSFEWFPGIPIFHSKDLVNWEQIGHVLSRPSQLNLAAGLEHSNGIWAPTIRFHEGLFYVIVTCQQCGGNFFVTASDPSGPWSDPVFIDDAPGIDPELFFDDDGKVFYVGSSQGKWGPPRRWKWEDRIYIQEIDLKSGNLLGEKVHLTSGHATNAKWCEGPHIFKRNGKYFLFTAEGGTWNNHSVTCHVAENVKGPYSPIDANPVLTHRYLGASADITTVGHADLVETQHGDWYSVMLGVRPVEGYRILGRETFLTSVEWEVDQPVFNPGVGRVLMEDKRPNLPWHPFPKPENTDDFNSGELEFQWNFLRTPTEKWFSLTGGELRIRLRPEKITETGNPSLIARRQEHPVFEASAKMRFSPESENETAGLVVLQNNRFNYRLLVKREENQQFVVLIKTGKEGREFRDEVNEEEIARIPFPGKEVVLAVKADKLEYTFYYGTHEKDLRAIGGVQDGRILTSNWAGGFTGTYLGMYASSNGKTSDNFAAFDYFRYEGSDQH